VSLVLTGWPAARSRGDRQLLQMRPMLIALHEPGLLLGGLGQHRIQGRHIEPLPRFGPRQAPEGVSGRVAGLDEPHSEHERVVPGRVLVAKASRRMGPGGCPVQGDPDRA
jgi:hypothetical protein